MNRVDDSGLPSPLAVHLTWTTYGTWLPGDARGWVERGKCGVQPPDARREREACRLMTEEPVILSPGQRTVAEAAIRDHCRFRGWALHAVNVRSNHVHVVVTADRDAADVRDQLKLWSARQFNYRTTLA